MIDQDRVDSIRSLLWNIFPQSKILVNDGIPEDKSSPIRFTFVIPEYRLALDVIGYSLLPGMLSNGPASSNIDRHDLAWEHDYRYITIPPHDSLDLIRDTILDIVNIFEVRAVDGGAPLLAPRLPGDSGWDLVTQEDTICKANSGTDIPSNLFIGLPNHLYAIVQARSSTSKKRLLVLPGVIDAGYRGRIYVMSYNLTDEDIIIKSGTRIAQLLFFNRVTHLNMEFVHELRPSSRGDAGFGSSGA